MSKKKQDDIPDELRVKASTLMDIKKKYGDELNVLLQKSGLLKLYPDKDEALNVLVNKLAIVTVRHEGIKKKKLIRTALAELREEIGFSGGTKIMYGFIIGVTQPFDNQTVKKHREAMQSVIAEARSNSVLLTELIKKGKIRYNEETDSYIILNPKSGRPCPERSRSANVVGIFRSVREADWKMIRIKIGGGDDRADLVTETSPKYIIDQIFDICYKPVCLQTTIINNINYWNDQSFPIECNDNELEKFFKDSESGNIWQNFEEFFDDMEEKLGDSVISLSQIPDFAPTHDKDLKRYEARLIYCQIADYSTREFNSANSSKMLFTDDEIGDMSYSGLDYDAVFAFVHDAAWKNQIYQKIDIGFQVVITATIGVPWGEQNRSSLYVLGVLISNINTKAPALEWPAFVAHNNLKIPRERARSRSQPDPLLKRGQEITASTDRKIKRIVEGKTHHMTPEDEDEEDEDVTQMVSPDEDIDGDFYPDEEDVDNIIESINPEDESD